MPVVIAIPIKGFDAAKRRLAERLSPPERRAASVALAERTMKLAAAVGATPLVVTADAEVAAWAQQLAEVVTERGEGLDGAAATATAWATDRGERWLICHGDLPLLSEADLHPAVETVASGGSTIAPSTDGGTSLLGAGGADFRFSYGPASFHRHLRLLDRPLVLVRPGLAIDLDDPSDLEAALAHPRGIWLEAVLRRAVASQPL